VPSTVLSAIVFLVFNESGATFKNTRIPGANATASQRHQGDCLKVPASPLVPSSRREPARIAQGKAMGKGVSTPAKAIHPLPKINQRDEVALMARVKMQDSVHEAIRVS
jgi:hypothetical protein